MRTTLLPWMRQLHLYLGVFTAPAILFFAVTGALQTFSLHENARDGSYQAPRWIMTLAQIHKKQISQLPNKKPVPSNAADAPAHKANKETSVSAPVATQPAPRHNPLPLKMFFLLAGVSLVASTFTGLWMSWKYRRRTALLCGLFLAGIVVPLLLMQL